MKFEYRKKLERYEKRQILHEMLPLGLIRWIRRRRYRRLFPDAYVSGDSRLSPDCKVGKGCLILKSHIATPAIIGDFTTLGEGTHMTGGGTVEIGKFCSIGPECEIATLDHVTGFLSSYPLEVMKRGENHTWEEFELKDVTIGHDVWVGTRSSILPGATVGHGCVLAAGAVVPGRVFPPYTVIGGVPARVIKPRFSPHIVERLLDLQWWNWSEEEIFGNKMAFLHDGLANIQVS